MLTDRPHDEAPTLGLPTWAAAPAAPPVPPHSRRGAVVRLAVALVVAAVLVRIGHTVPATVLLLVVTTVTVVSVARPPVSAAIDRAVHRFQGWAGRALTVVLLGAIHLAVFVPVSLIARVLRIDPLAPAGARLRSGGAGRRSTNWEPAPRSAGRSLHRRPFAHERPPKETAGAAAASDRPRVRRRPLARTRGALGLVALLVLADVGAGALITAFEEEPEAPIDPVEVLMQAPDVGARRGEPWAQELHNELMAAFEQTRYHPFRGWTAPDVTGRHVTVRDEVRRSYEPAAAVAGDAIEVFFFGGSTTMGWFQRDEHTIPSVIARLAEADGVTLRVRNYGQPAYMNWQEVMLLQELVSRGDVPHLAVFYDGANELGAQFRAGPSDDPIHLQARAIESRLRALREAEDEARAPRRLWEAYTELSALHRLVDRAAEVVPVIESTAPARVEHPWPNQTERPEERGRSAATLHHRGVELARGLGDGFGFRTAFFWQPLAYTKRIVPGEEAVIGSWGTDPAAWTTAYATALEGLHPAVVDVSDALDHVAEPVMYDFGHTNERGAEAMGRALYERLRPVLLELAAEAVAEVTR